jgi:hypothetical protein
MVWHAASNGTCISMPVGPSGGWQLHLQHTDHTATPWSPPLSRLQFLPFIQGPRNCLGQYFALLENRVLLSVLSQASGWPSGWLSGWLWLRTVEEHVVLF